jgi:hypothetical protein
MARHLRDELGAKLQERIEPIRYGELNIRGSDHDSSWRNRLVIAVGSGAAPPPSIRHVARAARGQPDSGKELFSTSGSGKRSARPEATLLWVSNKKYNLT